MDLKYTSQTTMDTGKGRELYNALKPRHRQHYLKLTTSGGEIEAGGREIEPALKMLPEEDVRTFSLSMGGFTSRDHITIKCAETSDLPTKVSISSYSAKRVKEFKETIDSILGV